MNLFALLDNAATRFPHHAAVCIGTRPLLCYAELRSRALCIAAGLRRLFADGDRVGIVSENRVEYLEVLFGIWAAGLVAVPINAKLHAREIRQVVDDCGATALFVSPHLVESLRSALAGNASCAIEFGSNAYRELMNEELRGPIDTTPESVAWLFYTSGTTGRSKGAMLTHRNLVAMSVAHLADVESVDEHASLIHAAPMSHGSGLYILPYVARGARQVVPQSSAFEPDEFLGLCDDHPACSAFLAPTMVQRLRLAVERSGRRPANLRTIVYGGGPMYVEELRKVINLFGHVFVQIYGQGEAPMTITSLRRSDHATSDDLVLGSVGWPRTGIEVAVVGLDGARVPVGEIGEIICRGDVVMAGYWDNATGTREALRGGWLYTGDLGSFDAAGYLTLRDRSKDLIISGGSNIYPREVEEVLLTHPGVVEACVLGRPDRGWGEAVVAFVVRQEATSVTAEDLDAHCLSRIARFKRPKQYLFVSSLPKNNYGKILKRELKNRLGNGGIVVDEQTSKAH